MPCRSDHMEPHALEAESHRVAKHIIYLFTILSIPLPSGVVEAAASMYGDSSKCDTFTRILCDTISGELAADVEAVMYNGRNPKARQLADWWGTHKEADVIRRQKETAEAAERRELLDSLTPRQRALLNIHD